MGTGPQERARPSPDSSPPAILSGLLTPSPPNPMNITRTAGLGLLVPALLALSPVEDELSFHPEEGTSLTKAFSFEFDFALDDVTMLMDGQDMGGMIAGQIPEVQMANTTTIEDTYDSM